MVANCHTFSGFNFWAVSQTKQSILIWELMRDNFHYFVTKDSSMNIKLLWNESIMKIILFAASAFMFILMEWFFFIKGSVTYMVFPLIKQRIKTYIYTYTYTYIYKTGVEMLRSLHYLSTSSLVFKNDHKAAANSVWPRPALSNTHMNNTEWSNIQALCINIYCSFICLQKTLSLFGQPLTLLRLQECVYLSECVCMSSNVCCLCPMTIQSQQTLPGNRKIPYHRRSSSNQLLMCLSLTLQTS